MFYYKDDQGNLHELHDENIVTHCPGCGKEMHVDLADMGPEEWDWYSTSVFCDRACVNAWKAGGEAPAEDAASILRIVTTPK